MEAVYLFLPVFLEAVLSECVSNRGVFSSPRTHRDRFAQQQSRLVDIDLESRWPRWLRAFLAFALLGRGDYRCHSPWPLRA